MIKKLLLELKIPVFFFLFLLIFVLEKKTLILDLDETLIHCNESLEFPSDLIIPI